MPDLPTSRWDALRPARPAVVRRPALVVARILGDPAYAAVLEGAAASAAPATVAGDAALQERFRAEALAMHQRHHRPGRRQRQAADPVAPEVRHAAVGGGPPALRHAGRRRHLARYYWHVARTDLPAPTTGCSRAGDAGRVSAIFVGSTWLPRHVVLVVDATAAGTLHVYDPARGRLNELDRFAFLGSRIDIAGWDVALVRRHSRRLTAAPPSHAARPPSVGRWQRSA